jgi:hypothetical protein
MGRYGIGMIPIDIIPYPWVIVTQGPGSVTGWGHPAR